MFILANLGEDRSKLSISSYKIMLDEIIDYLTIAQREKITLVDTNLYLNTTGRTYYEFQRGNRKIGELLFNIAAFFIVIIIILGAGIFITRKLGMIPEGLLHEADLLSYATSFGALLSFGFFLFPQLKLHYFLKEFKYSLLDTLSELKSRFEFLYFESLIHPAILHQLHPDWESQGDILPQIDIVEKFIEETQTYGVWSYDFPEIIKVVVMGFLTVFPLLMNFI